MLDIEAAGPARQGKADDRSIWIRFCLPGNLFFLPWGAPNPSMASWWNRLQDLSPDAFFPDGHSHSGLLPHAKAMAP
ncbi:hypothetical protein [Haloferula sp.]|uniref:hypothetical protein n=1 Tax=Haloferula sp. TaxID=2497595 RepID=UPI003C77D600